MRTHDDTQGLFVINLREYQDTLINGVKKHMMHERRVLAQLPTGGGKTVVASSIVLSGIAKNSRIYFVVHRNELLVQTSRTFKKFGIPHSFIAAGFGYDERLPVQLVSIQTLAGRLHRVPAPDLLIIDEAHHATSATYKKMIEAWPRARSIGLTATPVRTDGAGLGDIFGAMVTGPQVSELIEQGALSDYRLFVPSGGMDTSGVHKRAGDFISKEIEAKINKPKLVGDAVAHWMKHANGLKTIGFAPSLDFSAYMVEQFNAAGIKSAHLDGTTPPRERKYIIDAYAGGEYQILWNRFLFGEGFDLAAIAQKDITIDCLIDLAPTTSLSLAMQRWGRVLRPGVNKMAVILDHAGNCLRHGLPDDDREWTLDGREKTRKSEKDDGTAPLICDDCYNAIRRPAPACCPHCGKLLKKEAKPLEVGDGELMEADANFKQELRRKRKQEEAEARTLDDWLRIERERSYKHGWAYQRFHARAAKTQRA